MDDNSSDRKKFIEQKWKSSLNSDQKNRLIIPRFLLILRQNHDYSLISQQDTSDFNELFERMRVRNAKFSFFSLCVTGGLYFWKFYGKDVKANKIMRFFKFWAVVFLPNFFLIPLFSSVYNTDIEAQMEKITNKYNLHDEKYIDAVYREMNMKRQK